MNQNLFKQIVRKLRQSYSDKEIEGILLEYRKQIIKEHQEEVTEKLVNYFMEEMKNDS